jgi:hypothetical protein
VARRQRLGGVKTEGLDLGTRVSPGKEGRHLGAVATEATKEFTSVDEAIQEWEEIVGQDASEQGCYCCGQPHYFQEDPYEEAIQEWEEDPDED